MVILLTISILLYFLEVCCPVVELNNGRITPLRKSDIDNSCTYFYRDQVSYTCHEKYTYHATCTADGTWSPKTPECNPGKSLWKHVILEVFHIKMMEIVIF